MHVLKWAAVIVLSVGLGFCFVQYLVASPLRMSAYLLLCAFLVGLLALTDAESPRGWSDLSRFRCRLSDNDNAVLESGRAAAPG
jgi:hypothetical protein